MITEKQYREALQIIEQYNQQENRKNSLLDVNYLMEQHPELTHYEALELLHFCLNQTTVSYKQCYGDGSIMYPLWKESKNAR